MGNFKNTKYGPAAVSNAGGGGGPASVAGNSLVLINGLCIDASGAVADGIDPCAAVWPNGLLVGDLIAEYPSDATQFTITHPVRGAEGPYALTDPYQIGNANACDDVGTLTPLLVTVADGAKAGVIVDTYILVQDNSGNCACP